MGNGAGKKRILIVDDEGSFARMVKLYLEKSGQFEVRVENKPTCALSAARDFKPDLILLDVIMPKMGGFEACRLIRENEITQSIRVIMVTRRGEGANVEAGWANGCTDYVTKPINAVELLAKVRSILETAVSVPMLAEVQQ